MKNLSACRVLILDDAKANLDIQVEGLKADHKLSLAKGTRDGVSDQGPGRDSHPARSQINRETWRDLACKVSPILLFYA